MSQMLNTSLAEFQQYLKQEEKARQPLKNICGMFVVLSLSCKTERFAKMRLLPIRSIYPKIMHLPVLILCW